MVIYDNFVHADCHGGNIFVQKIENNVNNKSEFDKLINRFNRFIF